MDWLNKNYHEKFVRIERTIMLWRLTSMILLVDGVFHAIANEKTIEKLGPDREWARFAQRHGLVDVLGFSVDT